MAALRAMARLTRSEILREGMFYFVLAVAAILIFFSQFLPFFGDAESEIKLVQDMGFATMVLAGGLVSVLYASAGIHEDLENRTVVMILAKPVTRSRFVLGKYLGILQASVLLWVVLTGILLFSVWNEARHAGEGADGENPSFWNRSTLQGSTLAFVEGAVIAAIGVAASTVLPAVAAAAATGLLFAGGHLSGLLPGRHHAWVGWFWGWLPDLSLFRIADALAAEREIPWSYVAAGWTYGAAVAGFFLAAACLRMEMRDAA